MMVNEATINHLHDMRLSVMAEAFRRQAADPSMRERSFEERFGLMVDAEWVSRKNNRLARLVSGAGFSISNACIEDVEYHSDRHLNKDEIMRLATCDYIAENHNILVLGATGAGKSFLSCAFGIAACRNYYSVRYIRLPELLNELEAARCECSYKKVFNAYKKVNLLILDEWLLMPLKSEEARDLLEIIEARCRRGSIIIASQFDPAGWHGKINDAPLADAILDRIVHDSYKIFIDGDESMRKRKGISQ
jgi:DNA replication protein DnaC